MMSFNLFHDFPRSGGERSKEEAANEFSWATSNIDSQVEPRDSGLEVGRSIYDWKTRQCARIFAHKKFRRIVN